MNFASDNGAGVAPQILEAIVQSSRVNAPAYGADNYTARAEARISEVFERRTSAFLVATGTAANALALGALARVRLAEEAIAEALSSWSVPAGLLTLPGMEPATAPSSVPPPIVVPPV